MPGFRIRPNFKRNVHFLNAENDEIGGIWQNGLFTWAEMLEWMQIVFQLRSDRYAPFPCLEKEDPKDPVAQHGTRIDMYANTSPIPPGFYVLLNPEGLPIDIPINPENPIPRALTRRSLSPLDPRVPRNESFRNRVRARDGRCVITDRRPHNGRFTALETVHIFPIAYMDLWISGSWKKEITDDEYVGDTGLLSVQNGILLSSDMHAFFDSYEMAINPDNDYKVYAFIDLPELDGKTMFRNPDTPAKYQPSRALLKHHFRMAVLLNMKARAGYPEWDEDLTEGFDHITEISTSEQGKLRFETVLAGKLNSLIA